MKLRPITFQEDDHKGELFLVIGHTPETLEEHCKKLGITRDGDKFIAEGAGEIKDDQWIVTRPDGARYVLTQEEFEERFDYTRDYVSFDPRGAGSLILQSLHLVNEIEEHGKEYSGDDTIMRAHNMAWGLFRGHAVREYMRRKELREWSPHIGKDWARCGKCVLGKIRFTEEDYKEHRQDWPDKEDFMPTHKLCKECGAVGYVWKGKNANSV